MSQTARVTINHVHVDLPAINGRLDWGGLLDTEQQIGPGSSIVRTLAADGLLATEPNATPDRVDQLVRRS